MSSMYQDQYSEKLKQFVDKWKEMKILYIQMIELCFQIDKRNASFPNAKFKIRNDCSDYGLDLTDNLSDYIDKYFVSKKDKEYLVEFAIYNGCNTE
jgi:hypothetical protein